MSFRIHTDPAAINLHALVSHHTPVEEKKEDKKDAIPTIVEPEDKSLHPPGPDSAEEVVMRIKRRGAGTGKLTQK